MGYTDAKGIYYPQHGEDGWSDEMNANLTKLSAISGITGWNLFSEGTDSKNRMEGRLFSGDYADDATFPSVPGANGIAQITGALPASQHETDFAGTGPYTVTGVYGQAKYDRTEPLTPGWWTPYVAGIFGYANINNAVGATGIALQGTVERDGSSGAEDSIYAASVSCKWDGTDTPAVSNAMGIWLQPWKAGTGTLNKMYGMFLDWAKTAGTVNQAYGIWIKGVTYGTVSWNIYSDGTTTKNMFRGRVFGGVPNSAPTDADLANNTMTAYLNQATNKMMFRVRYSDGTYKTGEIALT